MISIFGWGVTAPGANNIIAFRSNGLRRHHIPAVDTSLELGRRLFPAGAPDFDFASTGIGLRPAKVRCGSRNSTPPPPSRRRNPGKDVADLPKNRRSPNFLRSETGLVLARSVQRVDSCQLASTARHHLWRCWSFWLGLGGVVSTNRIQRALHR